MNRLSRKGVGEKSYHSPKDQPPFQKGDNIVSAAGNRWIKRFQFESSYAFKVLSDFKPKSIEDMALVTAMIRPSGGSYRDDLVKRVKNKNPSKIIDDLLKDNYGYLVYQEDVINFLQQICGMSGSEADNVRRAIGKFFAAFYRNIKLKIEQNRSDKLRRNPKRIKQRFYLHGNTEVTIRIA